MVEAVKQVEAGGRRNQLGRKKMGLQKRIGDWFLGGERIVGSQFHTSGEESSNGKVLGLR